ncbi:MAG TPA: Bpu10I family restriction endonuclease, partial [Aggregatilineales bacterium]|nr:Bpu10I family restriction endonuclease [Aggregatilineales bacterium]
MSDIRPIHGDKLRALLQNPKLPHSEQSRIEVAFQQYTNWRSSLFMVTGNFEDKTTQLVALLNDYKMYLDLEIIYDSEDDFIYRQKGQLKLDNTAIEEFLPIFISQLLGDEMANYGLNFGATTCFSSLYFSSSLLSQESGAGIKLRQKNQDFVISRPLYLQASHFSDWRDSITHQTQIAYLAMECKTNLDKTMFQEASATASDLKLSVPSAKYYLLCEWLDMTPISSSTTAIDEVLILRKAKRLPSNIR